MVYDTRLFTAMMICFIIGGLLLYQWTTLCNSCSFMSSLHAPLSLIGITLFVIGSLIAVIWKTLQK